MKRSDQIPFSPAKWPFFYGWMILLWGVVGVVLSAPGQTTGVSAFIEPLIESLSIDRVDLSFAYMIGTLMSASMLTPAGRLFDRIGARWMGFGSCLMLGLVLILLSHTAEIYAWLTSVLPDGPILVVLLSAFFFLLRFSGQGVLSLSSRNMIMKWFDRHRGLAGGISGAAVAYAFSYAPSLFSEQISQHGWSQTWLVLGLLIAFVCAPFLLLVFRDNPEDSGLVPDGHLLPEAQRDTQTVERPYTLAEALRTFAFWPFALAVSLQALVITAVTFNIESVFMEAGMDGKLGFAMLPHMALVAIAVNLSGGWLSDRMELRWLLVVMLAAMALQLVFLIVLAPGWPIRAIIGCGGIASGLFGVLMNLVWPRYYGRKHLGAVSGFAMTMMVVASAVGPILFSGLLALTASYAVSLGLCAVASAVLCITALFAKNPQ